MNSPAMPVFVEAGLANAVVVKDAERLEQIRLVAVVLLEAADALARRPLRQQFVVLSSCRHAALVGLPWRVHVSFSSVRASILFAVGDPDVGEIFHVSAAIQVAFHAITLRK